jgi:hypothetical protein
MEYPDVGIFRQAKEFLPDYPGKACCSYLLLLTEEGTQDQTGSGNAKLLNVSIDRHLSVIAGGELIASAARYHRAISRAKEN